MLRNGTSREVIAVPARVRKGATRIGPPVRAARRTVAPGPKDRKVTAPLVIAIRAVARVVTVVVAAAVVVDAAVLADEAAVDRARTRKAAGTSGR